MKKIALLLVGAFTLSSIPAIASDCPDYIISGVKLTKQEKKVIQLKGLTSSIFDEVAGKKIDTISGEYSSIHYKEGDRVLYLDVQDNTDERSSFKEIAVVELLEATERESASTLKGEGSLNLLPTRGKQISKQVAYTKNARKALKRQILELPTCSF